MMKEFDEVNQAGQEALTQLLKTYDVLQSYENRKVKQEKRSFSLKKIFYNGYNPDQDKPTGTQ